MKSFKQFEETINTQSLIEVMVLVELASADNAEELTELRFRAGAEKLAKKLGMKVVKSSSLIDNLLSAGGGMKDIVVAAVKGDKEGIKKIAKGISKEDFMKFVYKLDQVSLSLLSAPLELIAVVTGWQLTVEKSTVGKADEVQQMIKKMKGLLLDLSKDSIDEYMGRKLDAFNKQLRIMSKAVKRSVGKK
jgi:hypothetical protein